MLENESRLEAGFWTTLGLLVLTAFVTIVYYLATEHASTTLNVAGGIIFVLAAIMLIITLLYTWFWIVGYIMQDLADDVRALRDETKND